MSTGCYISMLYPGDLLGCLKWHVAIYVYCSLSMPDGLITLISGNLGAYQASRWDDLGCQAPGSKSIIFHSMHRCKRAKQAK